MRAAGVPIHDGTEEPADGRAVDASARYVRKELAAGCVDPAVERNGDLAEQLIKGDALILGWGGENGHGGFLYGRPRGRSIWEILEILIRKRLDQLGQLVTFLGGEVEGFEHGAQP